MPLRLIQVVICIDGLFHFIMFGSTIICLSGHVLKDVWVISSDFCTSFKKIFYLFIFRKRGRERESDGEKHQCVVASRVTPTRDLAQNPGMCPDWESNW